MNLDGTDIDAEFLAFEAEFLNTSLEVYPLNSSPANEVLSEYSFATLHDVLLSPVAEESAHTVDNDSPVYLNPLALLGGSENDIQADFELDDIESFTLTADDYDSLFETVKTMYEEDKVKFDNSAEKFLQRSREIQRSAQFQGLYQQARMIEQQIMAMCNHDHSLQEAVANEAREDDHSNEGQEKKEKKGHSTSCKSKTGGTCNCKKSS